MPLTVDEIITLIETDGCYLYASLVAFARS